MIDDTKRYRRTINRKGHSKERPRQATNQKQKKNVELEVYDTFAVFAEPINEDRALIFPFRSRLSNLEPNKRFENQFPAVKTWETTIVPT